MWYNARSSCSYARLIIVFLCVFLFLAEINLAALAYEKNPHPAPKNWTGQRYLHNRYFAEGTTRDGYREYLTLASLSDKDSSVEVVYLFPDKQGFIKSYPLAAGLRKTLCVNDEIETESDVSLLVRSHEPFVAERPVYFDDHDITGGHEVTGLSAPQQSYYFAEGTTREGFEEWLCLANPSPDSISASAVFFTDGGPPADHTMTIAPWSRQTVKVRDLIGDSKDVSTVLTASSPFVAERVQYFNVDGFNGGHISSGMAKPLQSFAFAEGTTRSGYREWLTLLNPSDDQAEATVQYMFAEGDGKVTHHVIPPFSRYTIDARQECGLDRDVSCFVSSDTPLVGERPMYFNTQGFSGGHSGTGQAVANKSFFFAEGTTRLGFSEYLCLQNPDAEPNETRIEYMLSDGTTIGHGLILQPKSRTTVDIRTIIGNDIDHGTRICASKPLLAERPIYYGIAGSNGGDISCGFASPGAATMEIEPSEARLKPGEKLKFAARVKDANGSVLPAAIKYTTQGEIGKLDGSLLTTGSSAAGKVKAAAWGIEAESVVIVGSASVRTMAAGPLQAAILDPSPENFLTGKIDVMGSACGSDFSKYEILCFPTANPADTTVIKSSKRQVESELLGTWNTRSVDDGDYTLKLVVYSKSGGTEESSVAVHVDSTKPVVRIDEPRKNDCVNGLCHVTGTASDANIEYYSLAVNADPMGMLCHFDAGTEDCVDSAEPVRSENVQYGVGRFAQGLAIDTDTRLAYSVQDNISAAAGTLELWVNPTWQSDEESRNTLLATSPQGGRLWLYAQEGELVFSVTDEQGAVRDVTARLQGDDLKPGCWTHVAASWDKDLQNLYVNGKPSAVTITGNGTGIPGDLGAELWVGFDGERCAEADMDELAVYLEARSPQAILADFNSTSGLEPSRFTEIARVDGTSVDSALLADWDTSAFPEGPAVLRLSVRDWIGNEKQADRPVKIDNNAPLALIDIPEENGTVKGICAISGSAYDDNFKSYSLQYSRVDRPNKWTDIVRKSPRWIIDGNLAEWDTGELDNGDYLLLLAVKDDSGRESTFLRRFRIDDVPSAVSITSPEDGQFVSGQVLIGGSAVAPGFREYSVRALPRGLKFLSHFDMTTRDVIPGDTDSAEGPVDYEEVRFGTGIKVPDESRLTYRTAGAIRPDRGSVEMWMKSNWSASDEGQPHCQFITEPVLDQDGNLLNFIGLLTIRYGAYYQFMLIASGDAPDTGSSTGFVLPASEVPDNRVMHVAFTWGDGKLCLFIDGVEVGSCEFSGSQVPTSLGSSFSVGGFVYEGTTQLPGRAAIDELSIWDKPKGAQEIAADAVAACPADEILIARGSVPVPEGTLAVWETATVPDGEYDVTLDVLSGDDEKGSSSISLKIDNNAPLAAIIDPEQGGYASGECDVRGTASDTFFASYDLEYSSSSGMDYSPIATNVNEPCNKGTLATWDTTGLEEGPYLLRLTARDQVGRTTSVTNEVFVDNNNPVADIAAPSDGVVLDEAVNVVGRATDACFKGYSLVVNPYGLAAGYHLDGDLVEFRGTATGTCANPLWNEGKFGQGLSIDTSGYASFSTPAITETGGTMEAWIVPNWTGLEESNHYILHGQSGGSYVDITIGQGTLSCVFHTPVSHRYGTRTIEPGEIQPGVPFHIAATWNLSEVSVYLNGVPGTSGGGGWTTTPLYVTEYTLGGRPGSDQGLDGVLDEVVFLNEVRPARDVAMDARSLDPRFTATIAEGDEQVQDGLLGCLDAANMPDGDYSLTLSVSDVSGKSANSEIKFYVLKSRPIAEIATPSEGDVCSGQPIISGTACHQDFDYYRLEFGAGIDPSEWYQIGDTGSQPVTNGVLGTWVPETAEGPCPDGFYTLRLHVAGRWGVETTCTRQIKLDNTDPTAMITSPTPEQAVTGSQVIAGTAADENLDRYTLSYAEGLVAHGEQVQWHEFHASSAQVDSGELGVWDSTGVPDGVYTLKLSVLDRAGRSSCSLAHVGVNNCSAVAIISNPPDGATVHLLHEILGTATDAWFESYVLSYAPGWGPHSPEDWTVIGQEQNTQVEAGPLGTWDTSSLPAGGYTLRLTVNEAGGSFYTEVHVTVTGSPAASIISPLEGALTGGTLPIVGTASGPDFAFYDLEWAYGENPGETESWFPIVSGSTTPVEDGLLCIWETPILDCVVTVRLSVMGAYGHVTRSQISLNLDNFQPGVVIQSPANGQYLSGPITGWVYDSNLAYYFLSYSSADEPDQWHLIGSPHSESVGGLLESLDPSALDGGDYNLQLFAIDMRGLTSTITTTFKVDRESPEVAIESPGPDDFVRYTVQIVGTAYDANPEEFRLHYSATGANDWRLIREYSGTWAPRSQNLELGRPMTCLTVHMT